MFLQSFISDGALSLDNYIRFFSKKYYLTSLMHSFKVCVATTVAAVIVGVPMAYISSRYNVWGKHLC